MLYPLRLCGIMHTAIWGGSALHTRFGKEASAEGPSAESWELTVRPDSTNRIENGSCAGMTLDEYFTRVPAALGASAGQRFPLLVKLIDAASPLSVQVHPDDAYAAANENDGGKTEMWYIVDADPGARMVLGLKEGVTTADFAAALNAGDPSPCLRTVEVKAGDTYFVPAGYLHAIGVPGYGKGGILVAEIQQSSNLTYRVWDYNRPGIDGKPRQLHTARALDVIKPFSPEEVEQMRFAGLGQHLPMPGECLCAPGAFTVNCVTGAADIEVGESFVSLLCTAGEGSIQCGGAAYPIKAGDSYFLPAGLPVCHIEGTATILCSRA